MNPENFGRKKTKRFTRLSTIDLSRSYVGLTGGAREAAVLSNTAG